MDILKAFNISGNDFTINIRGTEYNPLFQANQIGEILELSNVRESIKNFDEDEKTSVVLTPFGIQQTTFLTEIGLYRLLGMSRKPIARVFQKWVCNTIKEIRINGKYELNNTIEIERKLNESRIEQERHKTLLKSFDHKRILYFTKIKEIQDNKIIIKLGWTNDLGNRQRALSTQFGNSTFLDIFECDQNLEFELFLKRHPQINIFFYNDEFIHSTETYLMTKEEYSDILMKIVKNNINNYQGLNPEQVLEMERIKLKNRIINLVEKTGCEDIIKQLEIIDSQINKKSENTEIDDNEIHDNEVANFPRKNTRQRKVQQYDVDTFKLIKTFDGIMEVIRTFPQMSKIGVKNAALKSTVYHNFRWFLIENDAEYIQYNIPPTIDINSSIRQYVALLNLSKTVIINVFVSQAEASRQLGISRKQSINDSIKKGSLVKGKYFFNLFKECDQLLQDNYMITIGGLLPKLNIPGLCIEQIDIKTKNVIKIFSSISDVLKKFCISRATLKKACETQESCKGFQWKFSE